MKLRVVVAKGEGVAVTCTVTNRSDRLVSFRANTGETWHLPPFASVEIEDVEVTNNPKIAKLEASGWIALHQTKQKKQPEVAPAGTKRTRNTRSKHEKGR